MQNNLLFHLYNKLQVDILGIYEKYFWGYKRQLNVKLAVILLVIKIQENKWLENSSLKGQRLSYKNQCH